MKEICRPLVLAFLVLSGCTLYPLGIPEDQWLRMTPEQQHEARMEQARQDEAARVRYEARLQRQHEQEQKERSEREQRLRQAVPGDVLQCTLDGIQINLRKNKWRAANPVAVELLQGESMDIVLERSDKSYQQRAARIRFERLSVQWCDGGGRDCAVLAATGRELQRGKQLKLDNRWLRGVLKCQYPPQFWHPG